MDVSMLRVSVSQVAAPGAWLIVVDDKASSKSVGGDEKALVMRFLV